MDSTKDAVGLIAAFVAAFAAILVAGINRGNRPAIIAGTVGLVVSLIVGVRLLAPVRMPPPADNTPTSAPIAIVLPTTVVPPTTAPAVTPMPPPSTPAPASTIGLTSTTAPTVRSTSTATQIPAFSPTPVFAQAPKSDRCNWTALDRHETVPQSGFPLISLKNGELIIGTAHKFQDSVCEGAPPYTVFIITGPVEMRLPMCNGGWDYWANVCEDDLKTFTIQQLPEKIGEVQKHDDYPTRGHKAVILQRGSIRMPYP